MRCLWFLILLKLVPKKNKVIQLVNSLEDGGLEQIVIDLHHELIKQGYESRLCIWSEKVGPIARQIQDFSKLEIIAGKKKELLKYLLKERPKIINYHHSTVGVRYLKYTGIKRIYTMHNVYTWLNHVEARRYYKHLTKMNMVVAVSESVKEYYLFRTSYMGIRNPGVTVIENAVNLNFVPVKAIETKNDRRIELISIANFYPTKALFGIFGLIEAAASHGLELHVGVAGSPSNQNYFNKFVEFYEAFEFRERIHLLGPVEHSELLNICATDRYDAFLSLSLQEGCSIALLEAIGIGLPIITTKTGNSSELSEKWNSIFVADTPYKSIQSLRSETIELLGHQVKPANLDSVIGQLSKFYYSKNFYQESAMNQASEFRKVYSLQTFGEKYLKEYLRA